MEEAQNGGMRGPCNLVWVPTLLLPGSMTCGDSSTVLRVHFYNCKMGIMFHSSQACYKGNRSRACLGVGGT